MKFDGIVYMPKLDACSKDEQDAALRNAAVVMNIAKEFNMPAVSSQQNTFGPSTDNVLYIPFGGDGTMLAAMRAATKHTNGSVFGINHGNLGFLTNAGKQSDLEWMLRSLITDDTSWKADRRMVIRSLSDGAVGGVAVNEFLITTPTRQHPLEYEIYINNSHVATQRGDGVIVTTATGSTAYSMSAGGAVMAPTSRAMQITPLAAHTLTSRPIVVSEDDTIIIRAYTSSRIKEVQVIADGNMIVNYEGNGEFNTQINKFRFVNIWRPAEWNFFEVLNEKMGWGI